MVDHWLKITQNSEVVMLEPFVELKRNNPSRYRSLTCS